MAQADNLVLKNKKMFKKKRDLSLFLLIAATIVLLVSFLLLYFVAKIDINLLTTIYLLLAGALFILVFFMRLKIAFYIMNYKYYSMLSDDMPNIKLKKNILTDSWLQNIFSKGFERLSEDLEHLFLYQFYKKLPGTVSSGKVLVLINIAKSPAYDFYSSEVDKEVEKLYASTQNSKRVRKQITIQFKKYDQISELERHEIDKIINYKIGDNCIINISVGYSEETKEIYFLRPKKIYPNAYYFYATKLIKELCKIEEDDNV